jgi:sulfur relay (sulfurtransferase) complex TusBCD TusD component (DsrE family)
MKIAILLKSGPGTDAAARALEMAADMLAQGHSVSLYLLQEAIRFCHSGLKGSNSKELQELIEKKLDVHVLTQDAELRGIDVPSADQAVSGGSYESLVDLMASCDRVVGIL